MDDELLVGIDDYKILDEEHPIGYTRDIHCCIVVLIHREKNTTLMHIETEENSIYLDNFMEQITPEDDNPIIKVDIFLGKHTSIGNLSIIKFMLHKLGVKYDVYDVFVNKSNETSVGYNFNTKDYLMARMEIGGPVLIKKYLN